MSQDIYQMAQSFIKCLRVFLMSYKFIKFSNLSCSISSSWFSGLLVHHLNAFKSFVLYRQKYFLIGTHYELDKLMELDESAAVNIHLNNQVRPCLYFSPWSYQHLVNNYHIIDQWSILYLIPPHWSYRVFFFSLVPPWLKYGKPRLGESTLT